MNKNRSMRIHMLITIFVLFSFGFSQELTSNILLGQTMSIDSKYLNETREVFIHTPEGYANSTDSYPVLYVLDGQRNFFTASAISHYLGQNQQIPGLIVVGIPNTNRNRDFTPLKVPQNANTGGAENMLKFIDEELKPIIRNNYRAHDFDILFGHSLCGMFSIHTLFNYTEIFDAHIAASPWLMYQEEHVINEIEKMIGNMDLSDKTIFISIGNEPRYFNSLDRVTELFKSNETGLRWEYNQYDTDTHDSIPIKTLVDGLHYIFSDFPITQNVAMGGLESLSELFNHRSTKYGMTTFLNENVLNNIGYQLLQANEIDKSIEVFMYNAEMNPNSSNVYDSLGDAYDAKGLIKKALKSYKKAVEIGKIEDNPNLPIYKQNVERLKKSK